MRENGKMKYILIIGDGMADNPVPELGNITPLEAANIEAIDRLCEKSVVGSVKTVPCGLPAGSDTAILSIFGNDPRKCYTGRSPLEAAGAGVKLFPGNVSFRCNMVALSEDTAIFSERTMLSHSGGGIDGESSIELITWLCAEPEFKAAAEKIGMKIYPSPSFRHIAVMDTADLQGFCATPPHDILKEKIGESLPKGNAAASELCALMELAAEKLLSHPVNQKRKEEGKLPGNGIWFWAEGTAVGLDDFKEKYGVSGAAISAVPLVFGIAALGGLDIIEVPGATGELDTNYRGKAEYAVKALETRDFVCIHVEAPDECTHNGDLKGKIKAIEKISSEIVEPLCEMLAGTDFRILILSDHKTLTDTRTHDGDPVPFMIYDSRIDSGLALPYCEKTGQTGQYIEDGYTLMKKFLER